MKNLREMYELGSWKGLKQYKCKLCPYDTLHENEIIKHIQERHLPKPKPKVKKVLPIYDRFGNLVEVEREQEV